MDAFTRHTGLVAPLDHVDVDTDQIIPKQFLKSIARTGFEAGLFFDWRRLPDGSPNPDFVLNKPEYQGASVLVSGRNLAPARHASMPPGRSSSSASGRSSPLRSATSFGTTATRMACCR